MYTVLVLFPLIRILFISNKFSTNLSAQYLSQMKDEMMDFNEYSSNCTTFSNFIHNTRYIYLLFSNTIVDLRVD